MGQEDYLLLEIEKIGIMLRAILNKLTRNEENLAITIERRFEETKEMLLNEASFDLDKFILSGEPDSTDYLSRLKGNSPENFELLADIVFNIGLMGKPGEKAIYLQKALQLYEYCNRTGKIYSIERESKISKIRNRVKEM